ncbi:Golgi apparatus membrane protein tvp23 [Puccinia graminis f. sp. tritici]|uniref:Golgi apparatus membrane protein TVP23 n=2 Tax=Puccinia graminis f. sp. tritici TaxID=56615 RepID=E3KBQ1_PUCGT|nr:uncharacterized protein PGTG_07959 [Puccinia graminis f. sp. tritici CRL 75-36-700-3]EFP81710.1 hypothetical protein PGTG_07959 [Puccinia graminis f. sp. tritici CRL 75-36-700-3]KAA1074122.1 Golgi apparatus membrane protein tvp23 [Puccinia graminis f. sp. tritici]KAA1090665.1 Golgi apparatus membrane protein tvp23 [Puccinia graminis f. sp. tritici]
MTQLKETLNGNDSSLNLLNSAETNGLGTISSDINPPPPSTTKPQTNSSTTTTTSDRQQQNRNQSSNDSNQNQSIWQQSSHPVALFFLFLFRSLAIATYLLCGFFSDSYVFSTVIVVILLSIDFWTVRNISGRVLVGLRFWNQVDEDGSSYWVFESRDPSQAANPVDSKMFWMALYTFPVVWILLLFIGIIKFNLSFLPIVILALVFNLTNTIGFTYADRDSKRKWANELGSSGINGLLGQFGGGLLGGLTKVGIGKFFG